MDDEKKTKTEIYKMTASLGDGKLTVQVMATGSVDRHTLMMAKTSLEQAHLKVQELLEAGEEEAAQ